MIVKLGDQDFKKIFNGTEFNLPIRWDGKDFEKSLKELFSKYQDNILSFLFGNKSVVETIKKKFHYYDKRLEKEIEDIISRLCEDNLEYRVCDYGFYEEYRQIIRYHLKDIVKKCVHLIERDNNEEAYEIMEYFFRIKINCQLIIKAVKEYLRGLPADAYHYINILMYEMINNPITDFYKKRTWIGDFNEDDDESLKLYRVVSVDESTKQPRKRLFHPPYDMRTRISTNRYSIAGFPSLYLGTSVELCMEEMHNNPYEKNAICSRFEVIRDLNYKEIVINVLELAIKPNDFFNMENEILDKVITNIDRKQNTSNYINMRKEHLDWISHPHTRGTYLLWYPLIAACSFIRAHRKHPFAPEYIVPQLLMQWLRKYNSNNGKPNEFLGLRYFSCYSEKSSDLGFNYVFPTSGIPHDKDSNYCMILGHSFILTRPIYLHNFDNAKDCEKDLKKDKNLAEFYKD